MTYSLNVNLKRSGLKHQESKDKAIFYSNYSCSASSLKVEKANNVSMLVAQNTVSVRL